MAFAMFMRWPDVTTDEYDSLMSQLDLDVNPAAGAILHVAAITDDGLEVCDVWQTEQAFRGFVEQRLVPIARQLGIRGEPDVEIVPLRNLYAANPEVIDRIGAVSLPAMVADWAR